MRNGIVMLVLVVGTVALLYTFLMSPTSDTTVPYSTFLGSVANGEVKEVAQQDLRLNVTPTKDATKYTVIVPGIGFTDVYADVRAAAEKGSQNPSAIVFSGIEASQTGQWISLLVGALLPVLLIGGFLFFMMRQAQGTNNQAMSFGKSRARMFLGNKTVGDVRRRGRRRRGEDGAPGGGGVPQVPGEVQLARGPNPTRRAPGGPPGHGQDPHGTRGRRRGRGALLQHLGLRVRRDVRRRGRQPRARPLRPGQAQRPVHRLRRRDRRRGPAARGGPGRQPRRARADPQPDPGRDGRLRHEHERDRGRRHQPARRPRSGPAEAGPLRPPGHPRPPRHEGPGRDPARPHQGQAARQDDRHRGRRQAVAGLLRRRPREPGQRVRDPGRPTEQEADRDVRVPGGPGADRGRSGAQEPCHLATRRS